MNDTHADGAEETMQTAAERNMRFKTIDSSFFSGPALEIAAKYTQRLRERMEAVGIHGADYSIIEDQYRQCASYIQDFVHRRDVPPVPHGELQTYLAGLEEPPGPARAAGAVANVAFGDATLVPLADAALLLGIGEPEVLDLAVRGYLEREDGDYFVAVQASGVLELMESGVQERVCTFAFPTRSASVPDQGEEG